MRLIKIVLTFLILCYSTIALAEIKVIEDVRFEDYFKYSGVTMEYKIKRLCIDGYEWILILSNTTFIKQTWIDGSNFSIPKRCK